MIWEKRQLADVCSIRTGKLNSNEAVEDGEYPFFTCAPTTLRINRWSFDTEAVLLAGNNAAGVYPLKYYKGKFDVYQRTYVLETLDNDILDIRYLYYCLIPVLAQFQSVSIGAATQYLTKAILEPFRIPVPKISVQTRIASILSAYDDLIENNLSRIGLLEKAARLLYDEWFVRLRFPGYEQIRIVDEMPTGWETRRLGDIVVLKYGKALKATDREEGPFPVYGSSGVVGTHKDFLVSGPAIIVGRKGNVGSVYWSPENCYPIDTVYYITSEQSSYYLYHNLQNRHFLNSDVAVPGLNRNYAYSLPIVIPQEVILDQFEAIVSPAYEQLHKLETMNEKLKQARDLLLPRLMRGEIAV